jgi:hypothetical protein
MNSEPVSVEALEDDVDRIRHNIGEMIRELDHRRRRAFDLKLQFQQHALRMVLVGAAVIALCAGAIALAVSRRRSRRRLGARAGRMSRALRRILAHPEKLGEERPSIPRKAVAAGGSAMASVLGKRLAQRLVSG